MIGIYIYAALAVITYIVLYFVALRMAKEENSILGHPVYWVSPIKLAVVALFFPIAWLTVLINLFSE